jgi:uncharacterized protein involved in exopolysaccharide biosynthesis
VTQRKQSVRVAENPPEFEPVTIDHLDDDVLRDSGRSGIEWAELLWAKRRFLWRVTCIGIVITTIIAFLIPKRYESTARIMPPDSSSGSGLSMMAALAGKGGTGAGAAGLSSLAGDLLGLKSPSAIFSDVLRSRTVQDRLIERFDLRRVYWDRYWEDARKDLANRTTLSEDRKSGVITITVTDRDPHRASQMAQAYVEELDHVVTTVATSSARRERIFIEQRLATVKQNLDEASRQFSVYASENSTLDIGAQAKVTVEAAARLEGELVAAQSELEGLEQIYTPSNVRVRAVQARVNELRRERAKVGGNISEAGPKNADVQQTFPSIRQLPLLGVRWIDLYRETKIQETVYELLTQQYELAKIQEAKEIPSVKILDPADLPEKKSFPPRGLFIFFGALLSFAIGAAWVIGDISWTETDSHDPRKRLATEIFETARTRLAWMASAWRRSRSTE